MKRIFEVFVPGRVCLFGEHSDWAGSYRRINSQVPPGGVIIAGTNQGIHARVTAHDDSLVLRSTLANGDTHGPLTVSMERAALLEEARKGEFFSYACGVAYHMMTFYHVRGIEIDNYETTMPTRKGLSSSAAMCVLVARAFNRVYDLKLTTRAEMEAAYQGEILTPSRCGRMDQACAFGQVAVRMTFDGDLLRTRTLTPARPVHLLVADLKGSKDTVKILSDLNRAYPFATDELSRNVQHYLGDVNNRIVADAAVALRAGDAEQLGRLMTHAQEEFDRYLQPASPEQLRSRKLHTVLADRDVQSLVFGGKGVGSQGDGCVQFVCRGALEREQLTGLLEERYRMDCFPLDLNPPRAVRKAVIPAAGFGTRMFPASKAMKKEFFPVVTPDGVAKPIIQTIVEEAVAAGIEEVAIIIRPEDRDAFEDFFHLPLTAEHYNRLPAPLKRQARDLEALGELVTFLEQTEQAGFGHAVYCAHEWVGDQPFLLMLGDHIYASNSEVVCARQLVDVFAENPQRSAIGLYVADADEVSHYGTVTGQWSDRERGLLEVSELAEKPTLDYARNHLVTPGLDTDRFLCVYGQYVLTARIFDLLGEDVRGDNRSRGEIQLTTALETLRETEGISGLLVDGQHFDTGLPEPYTRTLAEFHAHSRLSGD